MDKIAMKKVRLANLLRDTGAFKRGKFTLASGAESDVYVDCRLVSLDSRGLNEISWQFVELLESKKVMMTCLGGVTSGADPLVAGVLMRLENSRGFFVRKEAKDHGTKRQVEGHLWEGAEVVILDDVATSGKSCQTAVDAVKNAGAKVSAVCVIVDREAGAKEHFAAQGIPLYSLITLRELEEML